MTGELLVVRHARARRITLKVDVASGAARLTLPPRASLRKALAWAEAQAPWIAAERAKLPPARPFADGAAIPFADRELTIAWLPGAARRVERDGDLLRVGGPPESVGRRIETWLKRQALDLLTADTGFYAARAGVAVTEVKIGDPRGRWGSCAATGAIRYSWRLACAPAAVRRATAAHEVAHRVHMDHGPAFHALVVELYGADPSPARAWLRANGAALHQLGRAASY